MKTLREAVNEAAEYLKQRGLKCAKVEAEEVILDALNLRRRGELYLQSGRVLQAFELFVIEKAIRRRGEREPAGYIAGQVYFGEGIFHVSPDVMIPRPETEVLVEKISTELKRNNLEGKVLWDLCCGSGCIGISLKRRFPLLHVILSDASGGALNVARGNAAEIDIEFKQGDLFEPFSNETCDFFVCNPPYVSQEEYWNLEPELFYEPKMALLAEKKGFEFYERIAEDLPRFLFSGGKGWLEIGRGQGPAVKQIFESKGFQCHVELDWAGHDRFFFLERD